MKTVHPDINSMIRHWLHKHALYIKQGNLPMQQLTYKLAQFWYERRCVAQYAVQPMQGQGLSSGLMRSCKYIQSVHMAELLEEQIHSLLRDIDNSRNYAALSSLVKQL